MKKTFFSTILLLLLGLAIINTQNLSSEPQEEPPNIRLLSLLPPRFKNSGIVLETQERSRRNIGGCDPNNPDDTTC